MDKQTFLIKPLNEELGYDEVVDTISDAILFTDKVEARLADGFQPLQDLAVIIFEYPTLVEIWEDRKIFAAQFLDLTTEEAKKAVAQIAERTGKTEGFVRTKGLEALRLASRMYSLVDYNVREVKMIAADTKRLVGKI